MKQIDDLTLIEWIRFLADVETILAVDQTQHAGSAEPQAEIEQELAEQTTHLQRLNQLLQNPLGHITVANPIKESILQNTASDAIQPDWHVSGRGRSFWRELRESLAPYVSARLHQQKGEIRLQHIELKLNMEQQWLKEITQYGQAIT